ncbi:hypothetical protein [Actinacidiphila glaucinigra]|uniref:hypothetical protein n=1 Tax=Actinacidiphila glaucinigra TaxID=235986 RepID=UPI0036EFCD83
MGTWLRAVYDIGSVVVLMPAALCVGDIAGRLHGRVAHHPRVGVVLTLLVPRTACAVLGAIGMAIGAEGLIIRYGVAA